MSAQHTPGPWRYKTRDLVIHDQPVRGAIVTKVRRGSTTIVAELIGRASEANARLIAAAPELLAALKEVVRVIESNPPSITDTVWVTGSRPETLYDHCRAAIAKAEGGAT